jgi:hypothetical protein
VKEQRTAFRFFVTELWQRTLRRRSQKDGMEQCVKRIAGLGFHELFWSKRRNNADVLLVNKNRLPFRRYIIEQHIVRPVRASIRLASRLISYLHKIDPSNDPFTTSQDF